MMFDLDGEATVMAVDLFGNDILGTVPSHEAEDIILWLKLGGNVCGKFRSEMSVVGYECGEAVEYQLEWEGYIHWI